ncbi:MAG TPA: head decoration protein [Polyangiaceae bacterium]|nr:head decoration protein [Polyangiaceae bacterium]
MPNPTSTSIDQGFIGLGDNSFKDELVKFAGAATLLAGTIMARAVSDSTLIPYVIGGSSDGNGVPCAVIAEPLTATGAGNLPFRAIISGSVNRNRLVVNADGNGSNITKAIEDQLRARAIIPEVVDQIAS